MTQFQVGRALALLVGMVLLCGAALAQAGPRHQLVLADGGAEPGSGMRGSVQLFDNGAALIRVGSLALLVGRAAPAGTAPPDLILLPPGASPLSSRDAPSLLSVGSAVPPPGRAPAISGAEAALATISATAPYGQRYPLQTWEALHLSKGRLRVRLTALPDAQGGAAPGGYLADLTRGGASYRIYISAPMAAAELDAIVQRLPGADMVLLQGDGRSQLALVRRRADGAAWLEPQATIRLAFVLLRR